MNPSEPPVLLTSLASAVLLDGRGDVELPRETRGTEVDWGGVYAQLVRLTGPWRLALQVGVRTIDLPATEIAAATSAGGWGSHHRSGSIGIEQRIAPIADPPGALRTLRVANSGDAAIDVVVESRWSPFLLPVLIEGIRPTRFRAETRATALHVRQRSFGLTFRSTVPPTRLCLNRASWIGGRVEGPIDELGSEHALPVAPHSTSEITYLMAGGLERELRANEPASARVLRAPGPAALVAGRADAEWSAGRPVLRFPDAPRLERAYASAVAGLRRLYTEPGDGLCGLVAGYPWYSAIWCRDLAWMLPAVLWLGDADWVERSLTSVLRFQARAEVPILGGAPGELPMQIAPGPIFLYGTSDTTLYFPGLVDRYVRHSGRRADAKWYGAIERIIAWGEARTDTATGLIRNGGEAQSIGAVKGSVARVRYGIDATDTTIWDSTDRRDHAIDLQVLFHEALLMGVQHIATRPRDPRSARWKAMADRLRQSVAREYRWPQEQYLFDSIREAEPVHKIRPNALRAVSAGWFASEIAREVVERAGKSDLTTPWGVRTLSARDPTFDPEAYHDGQVWTIATAWAADAALAIGARELGGAYLDTIAARIEEESGFANECYRGDRPEPFDSCFLLGFSIAPFLTVLFERLWGLRVDATALRLEVAPVFPTTWHSASIERLTLGSGTVALDWTPERLRIAWSGPKELTVRYGRMDHLVPVGAPTDIPRPPETS